MGRKSVLVKTLSVILVLGWAISAHSLVVPVKSSLEMAAMSDVGGRTVTDKDGRAADLIVIGDIHTMDASAPKAEAIAVAGGRLVFVGDARQARALLRPGGRTIELAPGQSVLPGLVDSHVHMLDAGVLQLGCPIEDPKSKAVLEKAIKDCAADHEGAWFIGSGWPAVLFDSELGPRKEELDALVPDRPAVIWGEDGHSAWLNSARAPGRRHRSRHEGSAARPHRARAGQQRTVRYVTRDRDRPGRATHPADDRGRKSRAKRSWTRDRAADPARVRHHAGAGCQRQPAPTGSLSRRGDVRASDHEGGRGAGDRSAPASLAGR